MYFLRDANATFGRSVFRTGLFVFVFLLPCESWLSTRNGRSEEGGKISPMTSDMPLLDSQDISADERWVPMDRAGRHDTGVQPT
jgi:hypothetical protein